MGEFYIEDYIWLIVIGVFAFFVIIGYVADKTGLARKTFGKSTSEHNKKANTNKEEVVQTVPAFATDEMVLSVANPVNEVEIPVEEVSNEILEPQSDNLYLSDEDVYSSPSEEDASTESSELYLNNEESQEDFLNYNMDASLEDSNLSEVNIENSEEDLYQPLGNMTFDNVESEVHNNEPVGEDDVWQLEDKDEQEDIEDDLVLPSLDDLNAETDEDVWKF